MCVIERKLKCGYFKNHKKFPGIYEFFSFCKNIAIVLASRLSLQFPYFSENVLQCTFKIIRHIKV